MGTWVWTVLGALTIYILLWVGIGWIVFLFIINGITHTRIFQLKETGANPGFYTSWFVLNPYSVVVIFYAFKINVFTTFDWVLGVILGIAVFAMMGFITTSRSKSPNPS